MKQTLQLKLSQHLALTPQLQQSIRLLQLSTLELNQEIEQFLQDNPLLEREESAEDIQMVPLAGELPTSPPAQDATPDEGAASEPATDHGAASDDELSWGVELGTSGGTPRDENDDSDFGDIQAATTSLRDHLLGQLALIPLSDRDRAMVAFLIEALDDDGYLAQPLTDLIEVLPEELGEDPDEILEELQIALRHIQNFDPLGIGALTPAECLALQLEPLSLIHI